MFEMDSYVLAVNNKINYTTFSLHYFLKFSYNVPCEDIHTMRLCRYVDPYRLTQTHMQSIWNNNCICDSRARRDFYLY